MNVEQVAQAMQPSGHLPIIPQDDAAPKAGGEFRGDTFNLCPAAREVAIPAWAAG